MKTQIERSVDLMAMSTQEIDRQPLAQTEAKNKYKSISCASGICWTYTLEAYGSPVLFANALSATILHCLADSFFATQSS